MEQRLALKRITEFIHEHTQSLPNTNPMDVRAVLPFLLLSQSSRHDTTRSVLNSEDYQAFRASPTTYVYDRERLDKLQHFLTLRSNRFICLQAFARSHRRRTSVCFGVYLGRPWLNL